MGSTDRDYFREDQRPPSPRIPAVTKGLLISIVAIYLADLFADLFYGGTSHPMRAWGAFSMATCFGEGRLWELVTFQFLHGSVGHLLFNSLGLGIFAPSMEHWWGGRRFLIFYLLCGVAGALFFSLLTLVHLLPDGPEAYLVGASAGIYGCLIGVARLMPDVRVQLVFAPVTLTLRQVAYGVIALAVLMILGDLFLGWRIFSNAGGEAGHLGGAIAGYLLASYPRLLGKGVGASAGAGESGSRIVRPKEFRRKKTEAKLRPRSALTKSQDSEVDRILDKINREGLGSLSEEERSLLYEAAKEQER